MKKVFFKPVLWLLAIMFISPMFLASSCNNKEDSEDQDDEIIHLTPYEDLIIGNWETYRIAYVEYIDGQITNADTMSTPVGSEDYDIWTFKTDGKLLQNFAEIGSYTLDGSMLNILSYEEGSYVAFIKGLNQNQLILYAEENTSDSVHTSKFATTLYFSKYTQTPTKIAKNR